MQFLRLCAELIFICGLETCDVYTISTLSIMWCCAQLRGPCLLPFTVEKQTALRSVLYSLLSPLSNVYVINITQVGIVPASTLQPLLNVAFEHQVVLMSRQCPCCSFVGRVDI
jgi:hypothetical protein